MHAKFAIAAQLREIGELLFLRKGASFHARAYRRAADALEALAEPRFESLVASGSLTDVPGIGTSIAERVTELARRGESTMLNDLRKEFPSTIVELAGLPSMSLAKARTLSDALGIRTVDELEEACLQSRVQNVKGFGPATERKILQGIQHYKAHAHRILLVAAHPIAEGLVAYLERSGLASRVSIAGDVRRWTETTDEIAVVAETSDAVGLLQHFAAFPLLARIESRTGESTVGRLSNGVRVRLDAASPDRFAVTLFERTGAEAHVAAIHERASARGVDLVARGFDDEAAVYASVGLVEVPPELRDRSDVIGKAADRKTPFELLEPGDIRGIVHCHTVYSDGRHTVEEMARQARALGMDYLTITDHSPTAHYAGGVTVDRLKEQWEEIARAEETVGIRIFRGTESDILADGSLDYPDAILEQLDVIIASVHSRMKMDADEMTRRLTRTMALPMFKIWGHPLGRLIQRREPFACDVEAILDVVARSNAAVEINGDPYRLDLEPRWIHEARARGIRFVVSTDAHSTRGMTSVRYGIAMARRGGLTKDDVLNTRAAGEFCAIVRPTGSPLRRLG